MPAKKQMTPQSITRERVLHKIQSPVARLTLNNLPLNVIDIPLMEELARAIGQIEARPEISVIVLSSSGNAFSAGVDVSAHTADKIESMLSNFHSVIRAMVASKKVTFRALVWAAELSWRWSAILCTPPTTHSGDSLKSSWVVTHRSR
ncbi:MAG: hypothetical protein DMG90_05610 [Acidobacteria bacterium]|nr:MAG: hypothetical protein DMG90_05610 [Acidobacteriota bacterium]